MSSIVGSNRELCALALALASAIFGLVTFLQARRDGAALRAKHDALLAQHRALVEGLKQPYAQKLEATGRLAAGIAHEINTPLQFVNDSILFTRDAWKDLFSVVDKLELARRSILDGAPSREAALLVDAAKSDADWDYLVENVPKALTRSLGGLAQVANIVRSMKVFAHQDGGVMAPMDLNHAIRSTLTVVRDEYKFVADLQTNLGSLPEVVCLIGDVNQAVLSLVLNASHAIAEAVRDTGLKGLIRVETWQEGDDALIRVIDNGTGIPEAIRGRIFDPFFTTKGVGAGAGQGLSTARAVIVDKHRGQLTFESEMGKGSTFQIRLPIHGRVLASA